MDGKGRTSAAELGLGRARAERSARAERRREQPQFISPRATQAAAFAERTRKRALSRSSARRARSQRAAEGYAELGRAA